MAGKATLPWGKGTARADSDSLHPLHPENPEMMDWGIQAKAIIK
jgi:hypothetical protein